jgi:hypothetical protein
MGIQQNTYHGDTEARRKPGSGDLAIGELSLIETTAEGASTPAHAPPARSGGPGRCDTSIAWGESCKSFRSWDERGMGLVDCEIAGIAKSCRNCKPDLGTKIDGSRETAAEQISHPLAALGVFEMTRCLG